MSPYAQSLASTAVSVRRARAFFERHIVAFNLGSLLLVASLSLAYAGLVNGSVRMGYDMREIEDRIAEVALRNGHLEQQAREAQSLARVSSAVKILGFVPAETPQFADAAPPSVALAE